MNYGDGSGCGAGDGYGCGYGSGCGCGSGYGDGYGCGYGDGSGSGSGDGYGYVIGFVDGYDARVLLPWSYVAVGCQVHSIATWLDQWDDLAEDFEVSISPQEFEVLRCKVLSCVAE